MTKYAPVELVQFEKEHVVPVLTILNHMPITCISISRDKLSVDSLLDLVEQKRKNGLFYVAMYDKKVAGVAIIDRIDWKNRCAVLQMVCDELLGDLQRVEREVLFACCKFCFEDVGLNKVSANVIINDVKSFKVFHDLGFNQEIIKRAHYFVGCTYFNIAELSILAKEWLDERSKNSST